MSALESNNTIIVGKWVDKREVCFLTTKYIPKIVEVETKQGTKKSPVQ